MHNERTSFSLEDEKKEKLEKIAKNWNISQSEAARIGIEFLFYAYDNFEDESKDDILELHKNGIKLIIHANKVFEEENRDKKLKLAKEGIEKKKVERMGWIQRVTDVDKDILGPDSLVEEKYNFDVWSALKRELGHRQLLSLIDIRKENNGGD